MIQIEFARNQEKQLVHISEVSGNLPSHYMCPRCGVSLIPKVGKVKQRHFAHKDNSCLGVDGGNYHVPEKYIPKNLDAIGYHEWYYQNLEDYQHRLLNRFSEERKHRQSIDGLIEKAGIWLTKTISSTGNDTEQCQKNQLAINQMEKFSHGNEGHEDQLIGLLGQVRDHWQKWYHLVSLNSRKINYKLRYSAKKKRLPASEIPSGHSDNFSVPKQVIVPDVLSALVMALWEGKNRVGVIDKAQAKLEEIMPILDRETFLDQMSLYYLRIELAGQKTIYKIGITGRTMEERLKEIQYDLGSLEVAAISVVAFVPRMAHLESWYKRKFADYRFTFDNHQEYFLFDHTRWFTALAKYVKRNGR